MNLERYPVIATDQFRSFEFLSEGPIGTVKKVVFFQRHDHHLYNLAFGDWDELTQRMNDLARSNNKDRDKVIATVAYSVMEFLIHYPGAFVVAKGSTPARTRLYQTGINKYWPEISKLYVIEGFINQGWESFRKNTNYQAFLFYKRQKL